VTNSPNHTIDRILVVLANPIFEQDTRAEIPRRLCKSFILEAQKKGVNVDLIDLYTDDEFNPVWRPEERDTKAMEYQIRLSKAQLVVVFHPIWWIGVPAVLKGFVEKIFLPGFAYKLEKPRPKGLLADKQLWIYTFSERPQWEYRLLQRDSVKLFWKRGVADQTGMKFGKFTHFANIRTVKDTKISQWEKLVTKEANHLNSRDSLLDLL
jgi:NAD(P)H dehydrogenase (quinone)